MIQCWRLDDPRQTLVLGSENGKMAEVLYWGPSLSQGEDLDAIFRASRMDVTGGMLDNNPALSICPSASDNFSGQLGMSLHRAGVAIFPKFELETANESAGQLVLIYADAANGLTYSATFKSHSETCMIYASGALTSDTPISVDWLSAPVFPAPHQASEMIEFSGRWVGEFQTNRTPWAAGIRSRDNQTGRTGHEHFPGLIVPHHGATNTAGDAVAFHYGWSGGHKMIAEELPDGRRQIQFGHASKTYFEAGTHFETAPLYATFSSTGVNGCAASFQRHLRDKIVTWPKPDTPRPVHYNCWEAIYFDHDLPTLKDIATRAADLGAERFVLDDGWFGKRDDDTTSLGDWTIDPRKYPDGLTPLIDHIHSLGMIFGIWFEPEMVNPDSDLYRAHPNWALGGKDQNLGRNQMVLNMALPDVRAYLFGHISAVLSNHEIDYIKWDHNRVLPVVDAVQTAGFYKLLDKLRKAFPLVEIESCSSGGGRIDFGVMQHCQRVWLSDSNDAIERLKIQHNAALFLPSAVTGSHVGPRKCHTSGRILDIRIRAWVAAQRHMGFEMDPRELTDDEVEVLKTVTTWWKANRDWMRFADILRLDSADPSVIAEQQLAQGGDRFVAFVGIADTSTQILPRPVCLTGLDSNAQYRIELLNKDDAGALSRGNPALKSGPLTLSGAYLMNNGISLPWSFPASIWVIEGTLT